MNSTLGELMTKLRQTFRTSTNFANLTHFSKVFIVEYSHSLALCLSHYFDDISLMMNTRKLLLLSINVSNKRCLFFLNFRLILIEKTSNLSSIKWIHSSWMWEFWLKKNMWKKIELELLKSFEDCVELLCCCTLWKYSLILNKLTLLLIGIKYILGKLLLWLIDKVKANISLEKYVWKSYLTTSISISICASSVGKVYLIFIFRQFERLVAAPTMDLSLKKASCWTWIWWGNLCASSVCNF